MPRALADSLYTATPGAAVATRQAYRRISAAALTTGVTDGKVRERWFRDVIAANPDLVIEPCRSAEMTDEDWYFWAKEQSVSDVGGNSVGSIDVLLISASGRVGIVETKLAYNPERRRSVLAQILDYAVHFPELDLSQLPEIPRGVQSSREEIEERVARGDFLLIIAGDELDPRVIKLSQAVIGDHMLNQWELALVELAVYQRVSRDDVDHLIVPSLQGKVVTETRNVVRIDVPTDGGRPQVKLERIPPEPASTARRRAWTEVQFFEELAKAEVPQSFKTMAIYIRALASRDNSDLTLSPGTGQTGSITLKRAGHGLIELYLDGTVRFRPGHIREALGRQATAYLTELRRLFPEPMKTEYPMIRAAQTAATAADLMKIIEGVVTKVNART